MNEFKNLFLAYKATISLYLGGFILLYLALIYCGFGALAFIIGSLLTLYGLNNYKKEI